MPAPPDVSTDPDALPPDPSHLLALLAQPEVEVKIARVGRASVDWRYAVYRVGEQEAVAVGQVVTAGIDLDSFTSREVPEWLRGALEKHQEG